MTEKINPQTVSLNPEPVTKTLSFSDEKIKRCKSSLFDFQTKQSEDDFIQELIKDWDVVSITPEQIWLNKACNNDDNFTKDEFLQLAPEVQNDIFQAANLSMSIKVLKKFREFGLHTPEKQPKGLNLFIYGMDKIDEAKAAENFLKDLKQKGRLLTKEEFAKEDTSNYFCKGQNLGRILGANYIEKAKTKLDCPFVKVPRKIAVIDNRDCSDIKIYPHKGILSDDLTIYAEIITPTRHKAKRDEMRQVLDLLEKVRFSDLLGGNIIMGKNLDGEEGLYFIDTEYSNLAPILDSYFTFYALAEFIDQKDHLWLKEEIQKREEANQLQIPTKIEEIKRRIEEHKKTKYFSYRFDNAQMRSLSFNMETLEWDSSKK